MKLNIHRYHGTKVALRAPPAREVLLEILHLARYKFSGKCLEASFTTNKIKLSREVRSNRLGENL